MKTIENTDKPWYRLFNSFVSSNVVEKEDFNHQVAGHTNEKLRTCFSRYIMKPRIKFDLFEREIKFYEYMANCKEASGLANVFAPRYFGVFHENTVTRLTDTSDEGKANQHYIVLEDLTLGYGKPNLIDIKMGQQTYEPTASVEKVSREIVKYPFQVEIGFRITGFKTFNFVSNEYRVFDKHFGRSLLPECVDYGLALFFYNGVTFYVHIMELVISKLNEILLYMKQQTRYHYFCSSILIVYDSAESTAVDTEVSCVTAAELSQTQPSLQPSVVEVDASADIADILEESCNSGSSLDSSHIITEGFTVPQSSHAHALPAHDSVDNLLRVNDQLSALSHSHHQQQQQQPTAVETNHPQTIRRDAAAAAAAATWIAHSAAAATDAPPYRGPYLNTCNSKVKVAMIDFAHTIHHPDGELSTVDTATTSVVATATTTEENGTTTHNAQESYPSGGSVDQGYIYGLVSLIERLSMIVAVLTTKDADTVAEFVKNMELIYENSRK